jgi:hypothetical protein
MSRSSRASSLFDVRSMSTSRSSGRSTGRVDVVLFNGRKIAVPVDSSTSFQDLQDEALRRAARSTIAIPQGEFTVRLDGADGTEAFPEDTVTDILCLNDKPTVWLRLDEANQVSVPRSSFTGTNKVRPPLVQAMRFSYDGSRPVRP